ncbi:hypothetical protein QUC31_004582 [Theobroma cacao]
MNYANVILLLLFFNLIWHPISMIVFFVVFIIWFLLYFFHNDPLVILNYTIDDHLVLVVLAVFTIVALVLTNVWLNVLFPF